MNKIILLGYMGIGKSYLGNKISKKINIKFYDLDKLIIIITNISIKKIFMFKKENFFRIVENKILKFILLIKDNYLLSIGGGTPCFLKNMKLMNKLSNTVHIDSYNHLIYNRLNNNINNRPLLFNNFMIKNLYSFIKKQIIYRNIFYNLSKYYIYINTYNNEIIFKKLIYIVNHIKLLHCD